MLLEGWVTGGGEGRRIADRVSEFVTSRINPITPGTIWVRCVPCEFRNALVTLASASAAFRYLPPPLTSPCPSSIHCPLVCHRSATLRAQTLAMHFHFHFHFPESLVINGRVNFDARCLAWKVTPPPSSPSPSLTGTLSLSLSFRKSVNTNDKVN